MRHRVLCFSIFLITYVGLASLALAAKVTIPLIGCETTGQVQFPDPKNSMIEVELHSEIAKGLAVYRAATGLAVLAPRDWHCHGTIGSGGNFLYVTAQPVNWGEYFTQRGEIKGPAIVLVVRWGSTSGRFDVAQIIGRIFPSRRKFAQKVAEDFDHVNIPNGPYPADKLRYRRDTIVEFETPPRQQGLGTDYGLKPSDTAVRGVARLSPGNEPNLTLLAVRLPPQLNRLTRVITDHVLAAKD